MPAKVRDLRVCPFSLRQTLAGWLQFNIYKICIWTTYIHCTTIDVKITAFTKNDPPNGIQNDKYKLWNQLNPVPFRPMRLSNPKLVHSITPLSLSFSLALILIYIWLIFTIFTFSFPASFIQYSVSGLGISFFLTCRYCFRSLVPLFSLVWVFEMHATDMCHSCIVSACWTHTHYWWYSAYGFLICNRDVFTRQ